jgi:hypothetical protein
MMDEKYNQTNAEELKRKHAKDSKTKIDDTMLAFTSSILPAAEGCHSRLDMHLLDNSGNRSVKVTHIDAEMHSFFNERLATYHERLITGKIDIGDQFSKQEDDVVYEELTLDEIQMHEVSNMHHLLYILA